MTAICLRGMRIGLTELHIKLSCIYTRPTTYFITTRFALHITIIM